MKKNNNKILISLFIILSIVIIICFIKFPNKTNFVENEEPVDAKQTTEMQPNNDETYIDDNPIKIGIYDENANKTKRILLKEYSNKWIYHTDINMFNIFFSNEEEIDDNTRVGVCFEDCRKLYEKDVSSYRVGFHVSFTTENSSFDKTIISPKDTEEFYEYLEIYLYDGYHRKAGEWYSHTTEEEFNDETIFTGIKLTAGVNVEKINSDIILTAFSYNDGDDFDESGNYRGISKYSIAIKKSL